MKKHLFNAVSVLTYSSIWLSDHVFTFLIWALAWASGYHRWLVAAIGARVMKKVDPEEYEAIQGKMELESQQTELELLASASKLKEHAAKIEDWTDRHTEELNSIANALISECNWDEQHVHDYMRSIVESIPGLTYKTEYDEDDDDLL